MTLHLSPFSNQTDSVHTIMSHNLLILTCVVRLAEEDALLGQAANVKITAFDYAIFGAMQGTVTAISADAVPNEKGESFYQVRIETRTPVIEAIDRKLAIIPGMQAQVDIVSGKRTVLQYLTKPLVALKENAFRER